jgi:hypothetical protein
MRSMLVWPLVLTSGIFAATFLVTQPANGDADPCHPGELFVAETADPLFELQADAAIALNGAAVTGSTPVNGVFWPTGLPAASIERSREFHLCGADEATLHAVAEALRRQFNQESVLTFDYLPQHAPGADAIIIEVPDIAVTRLRDALVADSAARARLRGGSVTHLDGTANTLILVAGNGDRDVARRLVGEAGGSWDAATIAYGKREFVQG